MYKACWYVELIFTGFSYTVHRYCFKVPHVWRGEVRIPKLVAGRYAKQIYSNEVISSRKFATQVCLYEHRAFIADQ